MKFNKSETPADYVIRRFGGVTNTAKALARSRTAVNLWRKSKQENGTDGRVPGQLHAKVLSVARRRGISITAFDLVYGHK